MFHFTTDIDIGFILERISQEDIFVKYLGIYPKAGERYVNPLRENKTPNSEFCWYNGLLQFSDWGADSSLHSLSCFDVVKKIYNCSFYEALQIIARDFCLLDEYSNSEVSKIERTNYQFSVEDSLKKKLHTIKIKKKEFSEKELEFWNCNDNFNFNTKILESYQIYACEYIWYNDRLVKAKNQFAYQLQKGIFQIYSPFVEKRQFRFRSTNLKDILIFEHSLKSSKVVVPTKSYKDAFYGKVLGMETTGLLNEGIIPTRQQINFLLGKGRVVFLFDNDEKGKATIAKIADIYPEIGYVFLPENWGKDISDAIYNVGKETVLKWIYENDLI